MINIFLLPFAGGNKYSYDAFKLLFPEQFKLIPLDFPGHGSRIREPLLSDLDLIASDIFVTVKREMTKPYVIYGHSMGAMVAYLLSHKVIENQGRPPLHLFVSGCHAPGHRKETKIHTLGSAEFVAEIKSLGGVPDEIINDEKVFTFFEPILRNDFKAVETFQLSPRRALSVPITLFLGTDDAISIDDGLKWEGMTNEKFDLIMMNGNHFFIYEQPNLIADVIIKKLAVWQSKHIVS